MIKKIKDFLFEYDFIWTIPTAFLGFVLFPILGAAVFGDGFAFYPPEFFHAGIYAGLIMMLMTSFTQMGLYFQVPEVYKYYLGDGFNELETWQKASIFLFLFCFLIVCQIVVWATIV